MLALFYKQNKQKQKLKFRENKGLAQAHRVYKCLNLGFEHRPPWLQKSLSVQLQGKQKSKINKIIAYEPLVSTTLRIIDKSRYYCLPFLWKIIVL